MMPPASPCLPASSSLPRLVSCLILSAPSCFLSRRFSGPTVHFVNEEFDTGPILAQRVVPVYPTDTPKQLAARVLKEVGAEEERGCWSVLDI
jgi:hypothetical protein